MLSCRARGRIPVRIVLAVAVLGATAALTVALTTVALGPTHAETRTELRAAATCPQRGRNPPPATVNRHLNAAAAKHHVPAQILKIIAYKESGWRQFTPSGRTVISRDGGVGLMQVTGGTSAPFDACRLRTDPAYNIDAGAAVLEWKWKKAVAALPGAPASSLAENWYLPIRFYNGGGKAATAYADDTVAKLATPPPAIARFTPRTSLTRPQQVLPGYRAPRPYAARGNGRFVFFDRHGHVARSKRAAVHPLRRR